ncbi:MAG: PAS domain S-box protein, partial [Deltaproteobacteria bacterium]|nr:PAS domain S-box protein [Deltaproteobacteria bacterium]
NDQGEDVISARYALTGDGDFDGWGWGIMVTEPVSGALKGAYIIRNTIIIVVLVIGYLVTIFALFVAKRFSKPITELAVSALKIARGDLEPIKIDYGPNDEIGDLVGAFNKMTEDLYATTVSRDILVKEVAERKRAEESLRDNELRLRSLFETMSEGVLLLSPDNKIIQANPAAERILGMSHSEIQQRAYESIDWKIFRSDGTPMSMRVMASQRALREKREMRDMVMGFERPDGWFSWLNVSATPIIGNADVVDGVVVTFVDITELKSAEERIEHLNLVLRAILNVNLIIAKEKNRDRMLKGACEGLIKTRGYYNAWIALFDKSGALVTTADAGLGKCFQLMAERLQSGAFTGDCWRAMSQSDVVVTEDPLSTCTRCPLSVQCSGRGGIAAGLQYGGKIHGLLCASIRKDFVSDEQGQALFKEVADDIALALYRLELEEEHKRAVEAIRSNEEKLKNVLHASPIPTYVIDGNHKVTYWNRALEKYSGIKSEDIVGTDEHWKAFYNEQRPCMADLLLDGKTDNLTQWYHNNHRPSQLIEGAYESEGYFPRLGKWIYFTAAPLKDSNGRLIGAVASNQDITETKNAEAQVKALSGQVIEIEERERETLSREIHDNIGQLLFALKMGLNRANKKIPKNLSALKDQFAELLYLTSRTIKEIRGLSHALHPPLIEDLGIIPALEGLFHDFRSYSEIRIRWNLEDIEAPLESIENITLYRFFQEGLNNILKHSRATEVFASLKAVDGSIIAGIVDNGVGFSVEDVLSLSRNTKSLGLRSMTERLALIGGEFQIISSLGKGTTITASLKKG